MAVMHVTSVPQLTFRTYAICSVNWWITALAGRRSDGMSSTSGYYKTYKRSRYNN